MGTTESSSSSSRITTSCLEDEDEAGASRDMVGMSSSLFERGCVGMGVETLPLPLMVFVLEERVAANRDIEDTRSRTKLPVSGS